MKTNKTRLTLDIVTQEKRLLTTQADSVTVETIVGELTILPNHLPLLTQLKEGVLTYEIEGKKHFVAIFGGFIEISAHNQVNVLADSAIRAEEIDIAEVEKAKKEAEKIIRQTNVHEHDLLMAEVASKQALIKIKAAKRLSSHS